MIVSGQILDNEEKILPNVNVTVLGESGSTVTDINGRFSVNVNSLSSQIKFSLVGYDYDTYSASDVQNSSYINLYPSTEVLEDVNVPGKKTSSNLWLWLVGGAAALFVVTRKKEKVVKVKI